MLTLTDKNIKESAVATGIGFEGNTIFVSLNDGRVISLPMDRIDWLGWLADATPEQRENWSIEPGGFAIYWADLDDGFEVCHILTQETLG